MSKFSNAPVVPILTVQRQRVLSFIRDFHAKRGYAPTIREIAAEVYLTPSAVHHQLDQLQRMGWIRRHPGARALVVLDPATGQP